LEPFQKLDLNGKIPLPAPRSFVFDNNEEVQELIQSWDEFLLAPPLPAAEVDFPALEVFK
jgi:hypothetical protein